MNRIISIFVEREIAYLYHHFLSVPAKLRDKKMRTMASMIEGQIQVWNNME